jgi:hypothetical protein
VNTYIAHLTPTGDGIPRRFALLSTDMDDAREEARLLGLALFPGRPFTYSVRAAA